MGEIVGFEIDHSCTEEERLRNFEEELVAYR